MEFLRVQMPPSGYERYTDPNCCGATSLAMESKDLNVGYLAA